MVLVAEVPHKRGYGRLFESHVSRGEGSNKYVPGESSCDQQVSLRRTNRGLCVLGSAQAICGWAPEVLGEGKKSVLSLKSCLFLKGCKSPGMLRCGSGLTLGNKKHQVRRKSVLCLSSFF